MINGAHVVIYSSDPEADRQFLREVIGLPHVDVGGGWLIFALPPAEVAVHPAGGPGSHELFFMCDDLAATLADLAAKGVPAAPATEERWGLLTSLTLPGGGQIGLYEPRHPRPPAS